MQVQPTVYSVGDVIPGQEVAHRIGGSGNLVLKPHEALLYPPGISVLLGRTPEQAAADMGKVFGRRSTLGREASVVGTALVQDIRGVGFDVVPMPTRNFPNHGRLIHPTQGAGGFAPDVTDGIAKIMKDKGGL